MARPLRLEYEGAFYHITSRGNARKKIFKINESKEIFLDILSLVVNRFNWICHAYCIMDNHYHLLIETPDANLSTGMRYLNGVYTQKYNRTFNTVGHIFQGRFKAIIVEKESYFLELCRYVVLNPVRAKIIEKPSEWKWSSYKFTAGFKKPPDFLTINNVLQEFGKIKRRASKQYKEFILEGITKETPWNNLKGQIFLGEESFTERLRPYLGKKEIIKEIPKLQRLAGRPSLKNLFGEKPLSKTERNDKIYLAHVKSGYSQKEIADFFGIHYTTVSRILSQKTIN